jgi:hypothetical protein
MAVRCRESEAGPRTVSRHGDGPCCRGGAGEFGNPRPGTPHLETNSACGSEPICGPTGVPDGGHATAGAGRRLRQSGS